MKGKGIILTGNNSLLVKNKTLVVGDSTNQEIHLLSVLSNGELRLHPKAGAEVKRLIKSRATVVRIKRDINEQLLNDGFRAINIEVNNGEIEIDAKR